MELAQYSSRFLVASALVAAGSAAAADNYAEGLAQWQAANLSTYEYSYQRVCECHPEESADTIVTVRDGVVIAVRYARPGFDEQVALQPEKLSWYRTIDDLFSLVTTAEASAATVRVAYDPQWGFPASIYIDYVTDLVGDEVELAVTGFEPR